MTRKQIQTLYAQYNALCLDASLRDMRGLPDDPVADAERSRLATLLALEPWGVDELLGD